MIRARRGHWCRGSGSSSRAMGGGGVGVVGEGGMVTSVEQLAME